MKFALSLLVNLLMVTSAWAGANVIFSSSGQLATIKLQGGKSEDALKLYQAMNVQVQQDDGVVFKTLSLKESDGVEALKLTCKVSTKYADLAACVVSIVKTANTDMDIAKRSVRYVAKGTAAWALAEKFYLPEDLAKSIYQSTDKKFKVSSFDPNLEEVLTLSYAE